MKKFLLSLILAAGGFAVAGNVPVTTCVVSGEKLGEMGNPVIFQYEGQEIRLCCERCKERFDKNPAKYLTKLNQKPGQ